MSRLLLDRFLSIGDDAAWDVATGVRVRLRYTRLPEEPRACDRRLGVCVDWGATPDGGYFEAWEATRMRQANPSLEEMAILLEALDHGTDGEPRSLRLQATDDVHGHALWRAAAREARRRGYVPISVALFERVTEPLAEDLRHRTLALLDGGDANAATGSTILARAAMVNPRPHMLVSIGCGRRSRPWSVVREARAVYAAGDVDKYLVRADAAVSAARDGRHAQAERGLREAIAALARRRTWDTTARVGIMLGRLLLDRGRALAAGEAFEDAVEAGERSGNLALACAARVWLAEARIDADRLTHAEALLRATRLTGQVPGGWQRAWTDAVLARCLLAQARPGDALDLVSSLPPLDATAEIGMAVTVLSTSVEVLLCAGHIFQAGQRAADLASLADTHRDWRAQVAAGLAALRHAAVAGDVTLAASRRSEIVTAARRCRAPLAALQADLVWAEMLQRAGRSTDARHAYARLMRLGRVAPPLVKRQIQQAVMTDARQAIEAPAIASAHQLAIELVSAGQREGDDAVALKAMTERLVTHLRAGRVDVQVASGEAVTALVSAGVGLGPKSGARAIEAGIAIGPEESGGVWEAAAPIRAGDRTVGAVACRWPIGRAPGTATRHILEIVSAIAGPRVEAVLQSRDDEAKAALVVPELVGASASIADLRRAVTRAAASPFAVLIEGESGVGKELVARAIHQLSPRRDRAFRDMNCAALPEELIESELFGHARGAFTGAIVERRGLFEEAHGGTLFLDELAELSMRAQAKLLRVLQEGDVRRVGESFTRHVDVRIVAATNRAMADAVASGQFRHDLLYRLDVIRIRIPPLRERPDDIPLLARHFWKDAASRAGTGATLSHRAIAALTRYHWPGNVRELQNVMAALAVAAPARGLVRAALLPGAIGDAAPVTAGPLAEARQQFERRFVEIALARAAGSRTRAAADLGLTRQGLLKLMARLGVTSTGRSDVCDTTEEQGHES